MSNVEVQYTSDNTSVDTTGGFVPTQTSGQINMLGTEKNCIWDGWEYPRNRPWYEHVLPQFTITIPHNNGITWDDQDGFRHFTADVPGAGPENIEVLIERGTMTVRSKGTKRAHIYTLNLTVAGQGLDIQKAAATVDKGVVTISIPLVSPDYVSVPVR